MEVEVNKEYNFNDDQFLWKYVDLHRLIYLLNTENLFFSPLNSFSDPLEGITEKDLYDKLKWDNQNISIPGNGVKTKINNNYQTPGYKKTSYYNDFRSKLDIVQRTFFASCWYCGTRESLAMWNTYSNKDSVALKFKPQDLCEKIIQESRQLQHTDFTKLVHGKVEYFKISPFDPEDKAIKMCGHQFKGFMKDVSYKHEEEFRFIAFQSDLQKHYNYFEFPFGPLKKCSFSIITHPFMEDWKHNNIYQTLKNKGLEDRLTKSNIPTRKGVFEIP